MLAIALTDTPDTVPSDWLTIKQIAKLWRKSESYTAVLVGKLLDSGKVQERDFRIRMRKMVRSVPHYKLSQ